ncbi:TD and POZ domain-containing protein 1 [Trichonephila clavipes]|nr:TD and POZ domain-containing protein 1 [Trichonephila clavipes]
MRKMCTNELVNCEYVFDWEIENFSYCFQKENETIVSPEFFAESIEKTYWNLGLYPKSQNGYVSYYLRRKAIEEEPSDIDIYCDFIFLNKNNSVLRQICNAKFIFTKVQVEEKLRKITNVVEQFGRTVIRVDQKSFDWSIAEFSNMKLDEKKSLSIKLSSTGNFLSLDLFLSAGEYSEKIILVGISSALKSIKFVTLKLLLKDTKGNMVECGQKEFYSGKAKNFKIIPLIFTKNKLFRKKDLYLKDDKLSLCCVCAFTTGIAYEGVGRTISRNFNSREEGDKIPSRIVAEGKHTGCLKDDIKSLYNDITLSDTALCTEKESYPAHIAILCARSPVFKAMFTSDMKEKINKNVDILDLNDDTVQQMLLYMYTDTLENLQWESALLLYEAADKYDMMSLRNQCASFIESHLTPTNVCEALALADRHQDEDLKSILQKYIVHNKEEALGLKEWEVFMKNNSELAAETLFKICMND